MWLKFTVHMDLKNSHHLKHERKLLRLRKIFPEQYKIFRAFDLASQSGYELLSNWR